MKEIWKAVLGYEGLYEVSDIGRVRSVGRLVNGREGQMLTVKERVLKPDVNQLGYRRVTLSKDGKAKRFAVHRLVALAFIPNPDGLPCISHEDDDPTNNSVGNLRWCTYAYNNNRDRHRQLLSESSKRTARKRKVAQYTIDGELVAVFDSIRDAAAENGVLHTGIQSCCVGYIRNNRTKSGLRNCNSYKGYKWKYIST